MINYISNKFCKGPIWNFFLSYWTFNKKKYIKFLQSPRILSLD